jgi:hypothetical protein
LCKRLPFLCLFLLTIGPVIAGAAPHVSYIFPAGGQRGTSVKLTVSGSELGTLTGVYSTGIGLTATVEPGGDAATRTIDIVLAKDAPLGIQQVRFYGNGGMSNARYFDVGQWPEQAQTQAGGTPIKVAPPVTVNGRIAISSSRNGVTFTARAGETLVCEIQGLRVLGQINDSWLKGYLEIVDSAGQVLMSSDGTADDYYRWDPVVAFTPPKDGEYTAWFRDLNWRGAPMAVYRLTVAAMPHAYGIFPLGGKRGTTATVHFLGANLKDATQSVPIPRDAGELLQLDYTAPIGTTNRRPFQVSDLQDVMQSAGNSSRETAQSVPFPCVIDGRIEKDGIRDFYRFRLEKPQHVALEVWSRRLGTPMDPDLSLYDSTGKMLGSDDDSRGRDSRMERDLPAGEFGVRVRDIDDRGGFAFPYRLFIAPSQPRFHLVATPDAPTIARGGSVTLIVRAERTDGFDGDITVTVTGVPGGITAATLTIPKGQQEGKLTLSAATNAPMGPSRLTVVGTGNAGEKSIQAICSTSETYNIQGTAYQRDLIGPILFIGGK